ncbi:hypothetical protein [Leptospira inadai]|uniref:PF07611 family protein n=1 Tax=Leptospira inadai serovar Lyme TaxID=293084 RepID=A0ABX4YNM9_9LEPT|nr:hypothetical protein [Leptospira inadai]PNV76884.1 hypothetical protein BES34_000985 [Leptospira inadai serovar Lyme]
MTERFFKLRVLGLSIAFLAFFSFLDRIVFPFVLFHFPNELEWDTSPWFNFLEKRNRIRFKEDEDGVLVVGSSVALYSVFPEMITAHFQKNGSDSSKKVKAEFYAHPALTPSDFYFYRKDIASKKPELVFYVLNPADFQLDYLVGEDELESGKPDMSVGFDENRLFIDFSTGRHQNRILYPAEFLSDNSFKILELGKPQFLGLLSRSLFLLTRYRSFVYDPFDSFIEHHFRSGRSYHYYTGILPNEGIYLRGWTRPKFHIDCETKDGHFKESIFLQHEKTRVRIFQERPEETLIFDKTFEKAGWSNLDLEFPGTMGKISLRFETDKPVSSNEVDRRIFGTEEIYGIRLSQNFCRKEIGSNISYTRIPGIDDSRIADLNDDAYAEDYEKRIYRNEDAESALTRLKVIRIAKEKLGGSKGFFTWSELEYLKKGVRYLEDQGIKVMIVNSAENPIERVVYENSPWYKGYLSYLRSLGSKHYSFRDARDVARDKRDFLDPHHLTYSAARTSTETFSSWIAEEIHAEK